MLMSNVMNWRMHRFFIVTGAALVVATPVIAATVINRDDTVQTLTVTEGAAQVKLSVGPGESVEFCLNGCFVTMPNGDREVLTGTERLEIEASRGRIF